MKYFRNYPWAMQFLLFLLMVFTLVSAASALMLSLVPVLTPFTLVQVTQVTEKSSGALRNVALVVQAASNLFVFFLSALLFAYLAHPQPGKYLGLRKPGKAIQPILAVLVMLGAMPVLELLGSLIGLIDFGPSVKASQLANDNMMAAMLNMPTFASFIKVFLIMAIIPAVGEEMFFRGILLRFAKRRSNTMTWPILFTAATFAFVHSNIYGLLSILLAGVLLAVIYNLTGSLWCSILAHLFFNGTQIILSYASNSSPALKQLGDNKAMPYSLAAIGAVVFCASFYLLWKNRTPLPANWADDFNDGKNSSGEITNSNEATEQELNN